MQYEAKCHGHQGQMSGERLQDHWHSGCKNSIFSLKNNKRESAFKIFYVKNDITWTIQSDYKNIMFNSIIK